MGQTMSSTRTAVAKVTLSMSMVDTGPRLIGTEGSKVVGDAELRRIEGAGQGLRDRR